MGKKRKFPSGCAGCERLRNWLLELISLEGGRNGARVRGNKPRHELMNGRKKEHESFVFSHFNSERSRSFNSNARGSLLGEFDILMATS
ncbi:hypothetical protein KFK09_027551 [Dendrobium nobile]|uniref:Uncharacterized protein n=1 Tax=Dendrobium nobile TaxID=94219 RepID=A0A8T3AGB1_DENNO|nr:hypothetical protein KFK09_027551 [Dendrobium nobile]